MDADMNNSSQQADFFPAELEYLNKWIKHFQSAFLADDNKVGKTAYTVLQDASSFYAGCSIRAKERFIELIQEVHLLLCDMKSQSKEKLHECGTCDRSFKTFASLRNHLNTHAGIRPHCCKECDASFTTPGELIRHVRYRHTHEKPYQCTECDYASVELSKLRRHVRCHTGERPFPCSYCNYSSPDKFKLERHIRTHTGEKPYKCDICQAQFTQSNSLKSHKLFIHSGNKQVFQCDFCPSTCGRKTDLRIHVQNLHTSDKPLNCRRCGDPFPDRYTLKLHSKTHEGEKCFKCELCPYASVSANHLESHMLIHTQQKPFRCEECDQAFRQIQLLKRHNNLYHNPDYVAPVPKEKTLKCPKCNRLFRHKGNLIRHAVIHDPEASASEKKKALRIGKLKALGEESDGEEVDDDDEDEEEDDDDEEGGKDFEEDEDDSTQTNLESVTIVEQETKDGQQIVGFEAIELPPQIAESVPEPSQTDKLPNSSNDDFIVLKLQGVTATETPKRRGRPRKNPMVIQTSSPSLPLLKKRKATAAETPNRRGRPRKNPMVIQTSSSSLPLLKKIKTAETPKCRGRPRKNPMVIQAPSPSLPLLKKIKVEEECSNDEMDCDNEDDNKDNVVTESIVEEESGKDEMDCDNEDDNKDNVVTESIGIKRLLENFTQIFLDGRMSDLVLKVGSREFNVHKMVLVARSPVFSSLFQHVLNEKNTHIIEIPDCNPESFEVFLHYLYSGSLEMLSASNVCNVYYTADKYRVDDLKEQCVRFMKINLSVETICDIISLSIHYGESNLQKAAIAFFCQNVKEIIKTVQWQKCLAENPTQANELLNKDPNA